VFGHWEVPKSFLKHFKKARPTGAIGIINKIYRATPKFLEQFYVETIHLLLGTRRTLKTKENGKWIKKSAYSTNFGKTTKIYLPSALAHRITRKIIQGIITYGHSGIKVKS